MQILSFGAQHLLGNIENTKMLLLLLYEIIRHISLYVACFNGLLCMQITLNIIFRCYTSYSII